MTTFKKADWDSDVSGHECYQALFKESKQKSKIKPLKKSLKKSLNKGETKSTVLKQKIEKTIKKPTEKVKSSPVTERVEIISKSKKKRLKRLRRKLKNQNRGDENTRECEKSGIERYNDVTEDISENDQDKLVEKYHSELKSISIDSKRMKIEFAKEKRKQKKFTARLKALNQNQSTTTDKVELKKTFVPKETIKTNGEQDDLISKKTHSNNEAESIPGRLNNTKSKNKKFLEKLKETLKDAKKVKPVSTLRQKMMEKLKAARFRFLNEEIYTSDSKEAQKIFRNDPDAFKAYHDGYRQQVKRWPLNPLDVIIKSIQKLPKTLVVADFGCGDARLSRSIPQEVFSFDLVAVNESVTECDMSKVPLEDGVIDVAVFCLSLMGTNLRDYLREAHRVMKVGGILKIAEVESRFEDVDGFIADMQKYGFKNTLKDLSHNLFYFLDFRKDDNLGNKKNLPKLTLLPCLYKKR